MSKKLKGYLLSEVAQSSVSMWADKWSCSKSEVIERAMRRMNMEGDEDIQVQFMRMNGLLNEVLDRLEEMKGE